MKKLLTPILTAVIFLSGTSAVFAQRYAPDVAPWEYSTAGAFGGYTFLICFYCCIGIFMLIVPVALAIFVYKDAQKNKIDNAIVWAILTFFFNVIGLLIYFLAIRQDALREQDMAAAKHHHSHDDHHSHDE